ncbi:hypothetical protein LZC95_19730 [Pendulispora brunnea]|uniref:Uncharacterized protein n=1 Tax=Pendulispora brunnea TaxID=2905690 RepID=A0ABZ2KPW3_9BACT
MNKPMSDTKLVNGINQEDTDQVPTTHRLVCFQLKHDFYNGLVSLREDYSVTLEASGCSEVDYVYVNGYGPPVATVAPDGTVSILRKGPLADRQSPRIVAA